MGKYSIKPTEDKEYVRALHKLCFPEDRVDYGEAMWLVWEEGCEEPVGFCTVRRSNLFKGCAFLSRAGVLERARGQGLQRRLIKVREAWAKRKGYHTVTTYVAMHNSPSLVNLIKYGYRIYIPVKRYAGKDVLYLYKKINS